MSSNTNSIRKMSHQAVPRRILPKRARKETSYYPSESETGPESEVEDDEAYDAEGKAFASSKTKLRVNPKADKTKALPRKMIFPFMSLPAEIKNLIYKYALTSGHEISLAFKMKGYRHTVVPPARVSRPSLAPAIIALNHETNMQAQPVLYGANVFALEDPKALLAFCASIGPKNCAMLQKVNLKHFGNTAVRRAQCYPAFAALAIAVDLQILKLDCNIRRGEPILTARQFFRDGHNWLEAVGAKEGRRDAAVDRIELGHQNVSRLRYGLPCIDDLTDEQKLEEMTTRFRTELRRLLKA
ncbi:MAG: hypothetical protein Q9180_003520 [Flavoplaca navasiana]